MNNHGHLVDHHSQRKVKSRLAKDRITVSSEAQQMANAVKAPSRPKDATSTSTNQQEHGTYPSAVRIFDRFIPFALVQEYRVLRVLPLGDRFGEAARELRKMVLDTFFCYELLLQPETSRIHIV